MKPGVAWGNQENQEDLGSSKLSGGIFFFFNFLFCFAVWKGMTEDETVGRHHQLKGHGFGWTPGFGDGQGGLTCCGSWGHRIGHESD